MFNNGYTSFSFLNDSPSYVNFSSAVLIRIFNLLYRLHKKCTCDNMINRVRPGIKIHKVYFKVLVRHLL